ncbi:MAG: efflux RND transporter periplasmic adaptor subunit [Burkholderiales bacterium]
MNTNLTLILASLILTALFPGCDRPTHSPSRVSTSPQSAAEEKSAEASSDLTPAPKTEVIAPRTVSGRVVVTATVHQDHHLVAQAKPRTLGRILQVLVHVGDPVRRGQSLAILDSVDVGEARLALRQARAQSEFAETEFTRVSQLVDEEVLPRKELVRAAADREKARAGLDAARARFRMLGLDPRQSPSDAQDVSSFVLVSPLSGIVTEKTAVAGELAAPDRALFTVSDLSNIWVEGNLSDQQIRQVRAGAPAEVTVDAYPGDVFQGKVAYLASSLDPVTRTLLARVEVSNRDLRLKPQMFARMQIVTTDSTPRIAVPTASVVLVQGEPSVFVADGRGFTPRPVDTGETIGERIVIRHGLSPGDRIAVSSVFELKSRLLKSQIGDEH